MMMICLGVAFGIILGLTVVFFVLLHFQKGRSKSEYESLKDDDEEAEVA